MLGVLQQLGPYSAKVDEEFAGSQCGYNEVGGEGMLSLGALSIYKKYYYMLLC